MSNATQDSRNSGDNRRRRSRGGSNRNKNQGNDRRNSSGGDRSHGGRKDSNRAEEFRPQASRPARVYSPVKLSLWQKILKAVGLYKTPARPERKSDAVSQRTESRAPKTNTRNVRSGEGEGESRPAREKRAESDRPARAPREGGRPRGGDPKSVESTRVYVGNLSYDVTEQDLQELFKGIGGVRNVEVVYNRSTHRSKGYGFVEMLRMEEAIRAVEVLNDQHFMGRKMTVSGAKSKGQDEREEKDERPERESKPVVLASTSPAAPEAVAEPVAAEETPVAESPVAEEAAEIAAVASEPEETTEEKPSEA